MPTYSIPIKNRERYLDDSVKPKSLRDSRGEVKILWPITHDVPTEMFIHLEAGNLEWIELSYRRNFGELIQHSNRLGSFDLFLYHGHLSTIRPLPAPSHQDAYDVVVSYLERLLEIFRFPSNNVPGKWKSIFTAQLLQEQWEEGEPFLRRLLAVKPHPFR